MIKILLAIGIVASMSMDVFSCFLALRRNRRGYGASGMPFAMLIAFCILPLLLSQQAVVTPRWWLDLLLVTGFHIIFVFLIPIWDSKWLRYKEKSAAKTTL